MVFYLSTQYAYHLIACLIMSNLPLEPLLSIKSFIRYSQICKNLLLRTSLWFFLNLDQTTAVIISGLSRSIIIEKKWNFVLWLAIIGSFTRSGRGHINPNAYKNLNKTWNFTKVGENMCQMTLNSHAKFQGDRTIGGAYNSINSSQKHYISIENDLTLLSMFIIHIKHYFFILFNRSPYSEQLCLLD